MTKVATRAVMVVMVVMVVTIVNAGLGVEVRVLMGTRM